MRLERVFQPNLVDFRPPPGTAKEGGYPDNIFRHEDHFSEPDVRRRSSRCLLSAVAFPAGS